MVQRVCRSIGADRCRLLEQPAHRAARGLAGRSPCDAPADSSPAHRVHVSEEPSEPVKDGAGAVDAHRLGPLCAPRRPYGGTGAVQAVAQSVGFYEVDGHRCFDPVTGLVSALCGLYRTTRTQRGSERYRFVSAKTVSPTARRKESLSLYCLKNSASSFITARITRSRAFSYSMRVFCWSECCRAFW